jgi:hypothetical protein
MNLLESNMIRIEIETRPEDNSEVGNETLMFIHDFMYEMMQEIVREPNRNLVVVVMWLELLTIHSGMGDYTDTVSFLFCDQCSLRECFVVDCRKRI